jgi:hypothetical protein
MFPKRVKRSKAKQWTAFQVKSKDFLSLLRELFIEERIQLNTIIIWGDSYKERRKQWRQIISACHEFRKCSCNYCKGHNVLKKLGSIQLPNLVASPMEEIFGDMGLER